MISIGLILAFLFVFLHLRRETQFYIFSIIVFYPFTFGKLKSIPNLLIMEWLVPIFFLMMINDLNPVNKINVNRVKISYKGLEIFIIALIILFIWTMHSYLINEILVETGGGGGILRYYYKILINILTFFTVIMFLVQYHEDFDLEKWLKFLIIISILLGITRIITFFLHVNIPLLVGTFKYNPRALKSFGGVAFRIGGLSTVTEVGLGALFALNYLTGKNRIYLIMLFFIFVFMSGGRTLLVGFTTALIIYSFFFFKRNILYLTFIGGLALILIFIFAPEQFIEGQLNRITAFKGGVQQQSKERYIAWMIHYKNFLKNPFWGKGVAPYTEYIYVKYKSSLELVRSMLSYGGGHGSYISILGTFGLGGILYLLTMTLGGIILAFRKVKLYMEEEPFLSALAIFGLINLVIKSIYYITAFNGIGDTSLFFVVGIIASIKAIENKNLLEYTFGYEQNEEVDK